MPVVIPAPFRRGVGLRARPTRPHAIADDEWLQAALALRFEIFFGDPVRLRWRRSFAIPALVPGLGTANCVDQVVRASIPRQHAWIFSMPGLPMTQLTGSPRHGSPG